MSRPDLHLATAHTTRGLQQRTAMRSAEKCFRPSLFIGGACKANTSAMSGQDGLQDRARLISRGRERFPDCGRMRSPDPLSTTNVKLADSLLFELPCLPQALKRAAAQCKTLRLQQFVRPRSYASPARTCGKPSVVCVDMTWSCTSSLSDCPFSAWRVVLERRVGRLRSTRFTGGPACESAARLSIASIGVFQTYRLGNTSRTGLENSSPPRRRRLEPFACNVCGDFPAIPAE
jgi:hypothetical protein